MNLKLLCLGIRQKKHILFAQFFKFLLIFVTLSLNSINIFSQDKSFTIDKNNVSVKTILDLIEKESDYKFVYSKNIVDTDRKVSLSVTEKNIDAVLTKLFSETDINFKISENQIVLSSNTILNPQSLPDQSVDDFQIKGRVIDESGVPIPGANVIESGTNNGTITDPDGQYQIKVRSEESTLDFSFIGYLNQKIEVGNKKNINVSLEEDVMELDEVVVIGYGTSKKSDLTGSVVSVSKDRLENLPSVNVLESMQGAVAGVVISNPNARPGSDPQIYIRGLNSISASNTPLIVVDGIPDVGLGGINQNDIQSIEILKDASASAIYGARGSNGVILITTKRGSGKAKVDFNYYFGKQRITKKLNLMDGAGHLDMKLRAYELGSAPSDTSDIYSIEEYANLIAGVETDWQDVFLRDANIQEYQLGVSAGTENTNYYLSVSYGDHDFILQNFNYKRTGLRFNIDQKIGKWLKVGNSLNLTSTHESGVSGNLKYATILSPWMSPYDDKGNVIMYPANNNFIGNPIAEKNILVNDRRYQVFNNTFAVLQLPVEGLSYRINLGMDVRFSKDDMYQGRETPQGSVRNGVADLSSSYNRNWVVENILNYEKDFSEKHKIVFTGLYSMQEFNKESFSVNAENFPNDGVLYNDLLAATIFQSPQSSASRSSIMSYMARFSYGFEDKYLLTFTTRKDGFSGFGSGRKFGTFPSAAFAWRINNESFMSSANKLSDLKLRLSYGKNGNQAVSPYSSISNLTTGDAYIFNDEIVYGYFLEKMENALLGWESTGSFNSAIDFGFLKQRLYGSIEYYSSNTSDLLLERAVSGITGFTSIFANIGKTHNEGLEFNLNSVNVQKGLNRFKWTTNLNFSFNKNEIVDLYGDKKDDVGNNWFIGEPVSVIYDYVFDGIVQEDEDMSGTAQPSALPGEIKVKDISPNDEIDPDDRRIIGTSIPDFLAGMTNTFSYKGFDFSVFVHGVHGITKINDLLENSSGPGNNQLDLDYWTPETPSNQYPTMRVGKSISYYSSFMYESADYIRIKDISLGYTIPENVATKLGLQRLRLYVNGRNLFTFTNWQGLDPETGSYKNPNIKSVIFGINVSL
ncbi:MAG: TonB-dependent receptor [Bacteroidales bacterium]|nr:TonB-dependent receptor [Bacteroidales bacterium]MCF8389937.1 TonB-dependent receptor [Bacteroidales bacterium]